MKYPGRSNISGPYATSQHPFRQPASPTSSRFYRIIFSRPPPLEKGKAVEKTIPTAIECQNVKPGTVSCHNRLGK
jgi:hypothetical protein